MAITEAAQKLEDLINKYRQDMVAEAGSHNAALELCSWVLYALCLKQAEIQQKPVGEVLSDRMTLVLHSAEEAGVRFRPRS